ncbi:hypothetical protein AMS68_003556 [Peltaster fructicola]|uniref:Alpha-1,3-glucosyltransferase n=1 Tax=Peltaster fructicola TaxID=286661 RepID=A0A6H0XTU4_9PEZI|nr:hypothetical protein AMS68_003556 [Peltaster fructicola]
MHGDFEAQRHWMEVTTNLPVTHWYYHDLQWWGLDYPPLTAYHSWVIGQVGALIQSEWFALYHSRKLDSQDLKVFMRGSVIVSEYLIYIPAVVLASRQFARISGVAAWETTVALTAILMQPATMLIDHGHFQYNTVMLGFFAAALASMVAGKRLWSCFFFVAALGFKQMALFYAPAVAAYLAGSCIFPHINVTRFVGIAIVTLASFALLYLPLMLGTAYDTYREIPLPADIDTPPLLELLPHIANDAFYQPYIVQVAQSIHRIFPFARGLFEDKVANLWCAVHSSGLHKLTKYDSALLGKASLALTLLSIAPPCAIIFFFPKKSLLPYAFATTAWGFFMCSYQVHEKNVLLPLLPMTMLLCLKDGMHPQVRAWVGYANLVACWTLFPLLSRDQLRIPYLVMTMLWAWLLGLPPTSLQAYSGSNKQIDLDIGSKMIHLLTYAAMIIWHIVEFTIDPPTSKPDLWVVANACIGAGAFGLCYLWCLLRMVLNSPLIFLGLRPRQKTHTKKTQ